MRSLSVCLFALVAATFVACAFGAEDLGGDNTGDDDSPDARDTIDGPPLPIDARPPDAGPPIDASFPIDASSPIDGPPGGGLICSSTADCAGTPGTCCFMLGQPPGFCVPGSEPIPGVCLPQ